jgi:hypothetical protein
MLLLSALFALLAAAKASSSSFDFFLGFGLLTLAPFLGPWAEPLAYVDYDLSRMFLWSAILFAVMLCGLVLRPREFCSLIYISSVPWFLIGFAYTYYGV